MEEIDAHTHSDIMLQWKGLAERIPTHIRRVVRYLYTYEYNTNAGKWVVPHVPCSPQQPDMYSKTQTHIFKQFDGMRIQEKMLF